VSKAPIDLAADSTADQDIDTRPHADEAEALFKEARQRQRRRRAWLAAVVVLAIALIAAGLLLAGRGSNQGSPRTTHPTVRPPVPARPRPNNGAVAASEYVPVQTMGLAGSQLAWAANGTNLQVTADGGQTWRSVTPPNLSAMTVSEHISAVDAVGPEDLWVVIEDVPGLVPFSQSVDGSDRGEGIDRSTDGGRTWTFSAVPPGCLQTCGPISVSFVDAEHGYAEASPQSGGSRLFATDDGGSTWLPVASMPNLGSVLVGGPIAQPQLLFTSRLDGWALTGPSGYGPKGQPTTLGGALYRTTDGGLSWTKAPSLPVGLRYTLPAFFGAEHGVVVAMQSTESDHGTSVFVTNNAGATWARHPLPTFPYVEIEPGNLQTRFAAVGPMSWRIDVGSALYVTNNSGHSWTTITPSPQFAPGGVHSLAFSSPDNGIAIGQPLRCSTPSTLVSCFPTLLVTGDGGRLWRAAQF